MKLKISPLALIDLEESIEYYNLQQENLGDDFAEKINFTFERIKENPKQFPKEFKEMRKAQTERFPFNIFFVSRENIAYILGIFHLRRNPKILKDRYKTI